RGVIESAKGVIAQAIPEKLDLTSPSFDSSNPFRIADFGCSTGPNTFIAMQNIVDAVTLKYQQSKPDDNPGAPEFHVFFNDHVDNDFNILFKTLPPSRPYFAAGVPGSFYIRLFPAASLHIAHSSYALHWLSKVPPEIVDKNSPAWNKGKIYCAGNDEEVTKAYFAQFQVDMEAFLDARYRELVGGGLVVIQMPCVPNGGVLPSQTGAGMIHELLGDSFFDMVNMGIIPEEKVNSFNLPQYLPSIEELEKVIETNNRFTIEKIGTLSHPTNAAPFDVKRSAAQVRAIMESIMEEHFGSQHMDQLFGLFAEKLEESRLVFDKEIRKDVDLFVLLKRKN
ncbi:hypothetical protein U1Q18_024792, partial [Sarracenia purpurea var. burkii]